MSSRKFSIIGCEHAHIGMFIQEMKDLGWECAGIYEPNNKQLAEQFSRQYHIPLADDRETLLGEHIEVVGCAAINHEKIDIVELCEERGKHVMVDKPLVTTCEDLERLKAVLDRGKIEVGMLLTERYRPSIRKLKMMLDQGELGDIVSFYIRKPHRLSPARRPEWHFIKRKNGGIVVDLSVHDFDLLHWLTKSQVREMRKTIMPEYPDFYDAYSLQVQMDNGVLAQLYADWHHPEGSWTWGDCRIFVTGTKGVAELRLEGDPLIETEELLLLVTQERGLTKVPLDDLPAATLAGDFLRRIEGTPAGIGHEDLYSASLAALQADERVRIG